MSAKPELLAAIVAGLRGDLDRGHEYHAGPVRALSQPVGQTPRATVLRSSRGVVGQTNGAREERILFLLLYRFFEQDDIRLDIRLN
jgi:hypothetical protein